MKDDHRVLVFTDLDGSLLDHETYDYAAARPALETLNTLNIPIIPTTSKTLAEIKALPICFGTSPQIAENGMVIDVLAGFFPQMEEKKVIPGASYQDILRFISALPEDLRSHINNFARMGVDGIMASTGLPRQDAANAMAREASEPFLWMGQDHGIEALEVAAHKANLTLTKGGRFYHLMGHGGKDQALRWVSDTLREQMQGRVRITTIALGDGQNDAKMIAQADYGVVIPNIDGHVIDVHDAKGVVFEAQHAGPAGWAQAIERILGQIL